MASPCMGFPRKWYIDVMGWTTNWLTQKKNFLNFQGGKKNETTCWIFLEPVRFLGRFPTTIEWFVVYFAGSTYCFPTVLLSFSAFFLCITAANSIVLYSCWRAQIYLIGLASFVRTSYCKNGSSLVTEAASIPTSVLWGVAGEDGKSSFASTFFAFATTWVKRRCWVFHITRIDWCFWLHPHSWFYKVAQKKRHKHVQSILEAVRFLGWFQTEGPFLPNHHEEGVGSEDKMLETASFIQKIWPDQFGLSTFPVVTI